MMRFDHLRIPVSDLARSRRWYVDTFQLTVEFEVPDRRTVALQDGADFTIFLQEVDPPITPNGCALWFQVEDVGTTLGPEMKSTGEVMGVGTTFAEWSARGVTFSHGPRKSYWGYGAELTDPDGYLVRLWDERSMKAH